jgi:two-component system repressor protein LuxO
VDAVPDVVLLCARPEDRPLELLGELRDRFEHLPVIVVTSEVDASLVAEGMRQGAFDFLSRPVDSTHLLIEVQNAARMHRLMIKVNQLQGAYHRRGQFMGIVGASPRMQAIYSVIESVGGTDVTVFITGASGTGKELVARAVHDTSPRSRRAFVAINCAAIPKDLLESELFGHERGAFTGATSCHHGCCEQAAGGTLFLDEICEMDIHLQSKLLRFLQERRFHRLGGKEEVRVDVRVVAATNREPIDEVRRGRLREDLYYRLNVVPIEVPALRERREDIPLLASTFLERFSTKHGKYFYDFAPDAMSALISYDWPGNVREIENAVERVVVLHNASRVTKQMLPEAVVSEARRRGAETEEDGVILPMKDLERRAIERALSICGGNVSRAARQLAIGQATLYRKIKKFGLMVNR